METSSLFIPQDIVNIIVDRIASDYQGSSRMKKTHPLHTCALICHAFHMRATHHMFSKVQILQKSMGHEENMRLNERVARFLDLLQHNPAISIIVRTLVIHATHGPNGILSNPYYCKSMDGSDHHADVTNPLVDLLSSFPTLQRFVLRKGLDPYPSQSISIPDQNKNPSMIYWEDLPRNITFALRALFRSPSLVDLELSDIWALPIETLWDACQIKRLTLRHISLKPTKNDHYLRTLHLDAELSEQYPWMEESILSAAYMLDSADLDMYIFRSFGRCSLAGNATPQVFSRLRRLSLTIRSNNHIKPAWALIRHAAQTLEILDLVFLYTDFEGEVWMDPLPFGSLWALCHLHVTCHVKGLISIPSCLIPIFDLQNSSSNLEAIHIITDWSLLVHMTAYTHLDKILQNIDLVLSDKNFCCLKEVKFLQMAKDSTALTATVLTHPDPIHDFNLLCYLPRLSALKLLSST